MTQLAYTVGQKINGLASFREAKTTPPKPFTDGDLVMIMEDVVRFYDGDDKAAKMVLKDIGLGTARTRGEIIKGLFDRGLIEFIPGENKRKKKTSFIRPTEKGIRIIHILRKAAPHIPSPETTARWEEALRKIERGEVTVEQFRQKQVQFCQQMVAAVIAAPGAKLEPVKVAERPQVEPLDGHGKPCEKCKKGTLDTSVVRKEGSKFFGQRFLRCNNKGCDFMKFPEQKK